MRVLRTGFRRAVDMLPARTVVPIATGPNRGYRWVLHSTVNSCWLGWFERDTQDALRRLIRPGMTVLDAGANVGFFTLLAARLVGPSGHVDAFEPYPPNTALLQKHVQLNKLRNVRIESVALSDRADVLPLYVGDSTSGSLFPLDSGLTPHMVPVVSLDEWRAKGLLPRRLDVVKMDIEGAEGAAILGMLNVLRTDRPALHISLHGGPRQAEMIGALEGIGYKTEVGMNGDLIAYQ